MSLQGKLIDLIYKNKQLVFKLFPIKLLRKLKKIVIKRNILKLGKEKRIKFQRDFYPDGINLIGGIKYSTGLGQSCRLLATVIDKSNYNYMIYNFEQSGQLRPDDDSWNHKIEPECKYNINIIHINPNELGIALSHFDKKIFDYRYNIGFWLWEFQEFPDEWISFENVLDEIWTPSDFITDALKKKFSIPIYTVPYAITADVDDKITRDYFHLPNNKFLFLMMYDKQSISDRKNPISAINAYKKCVDSLSSNEDIGLVIKIGSCNNNELINLKKIVENYDNIYFITEHLSKINVNSLINCCDAIISLHRAEGYGLVLAEAMYLGKPVIATNWSANTEFMNSDNSCLVDYKLVQLTADDGPYEKGWLWAEPDIDDAAKHMQKLFENNIFYDSISEKAKKYMINKLNIEKNTSIIVKRISEIYEE